MKMKLYALKDEHTGYAPPTVFPNEEVAKRWFKEMKTENITVKLSPSDFSLWQIGEYDSETGEIEQEKKLIERG